MTIPDFYVGGGNKQYGNVNNGSKKLQKNILFTLAYYASQNHPLTSFEVWRHMHDFSKTGKVDFSDVVLGLEILKERKIIENHKSFWVFIGDHSNLSDKRIVRQKISSREIKRALGWARAASFLPYVRGVFCVGTLGMKKAGFKSDWDVLVVLGQGRIWIGRLLLTLFFQVFGKRRTDKKIKGRFCLNHFLAENGLIMEERNEYTSKEISFSYPLVGKDQFNKFMQLNGFWVSKFLPNFEKDKIHLRTSCFWLADSAKRTRKILEKIMEIFSLGRLINKACKSVMIEKIKKNKKTYYKGADVRYNDQSLVFLPKPQRDVLLEKTVEMVRRLKLGNGHNRVPG